ncbi:ribosome-inactivating family protein [Streptomyces racemochromogenes]|uniref:Ribosome-inactivating family protein n=1 Tax=Streptomyces racemochromogenes TaxID=67353 RepID=A0ABW7PEP1_9ACTN
MTRKLCSTLLAFAMTLGLVSGLSGTAHAANYQVIDWNISDITAGGQEHALNYYRMIDRIHQLSYGDVTGEQGVTQTTLEQDRIIQVRIRDTGGNDLVSIYLWADTLYVAGFYAPRSTADVRHFEFSDNRAGFAGVLGIDSAQFLGRNGNYDALPGGSSRENLVLTPSSIYNAAYTLGHANGYTDQVGRSLLVMIQVLSEAARFGRILERVYDNIYNHRENALGWEYRWLENEWGHLADFIRERHRGHQAQFNYRGQIITTLEQLRQRLSFIEVQGAIFQKRP